MNNLILIGKINELFDGTDYKDSREYIELKFLLLRDENNQLKLFLHKQEEPLKEHADAVGFYLIEKGLEHIVVRGGGMIDFYNGDYKEINFKGASGTFGWAQNDEVLSVAEKIWPDYKIRFQKTFPDPKERDYEPYFQFLKEKRSKFKDSDFIITEI